ncbi:MAG: tetratricopeptide repeat protein [Gemmatimonadota bacterium]|nr:tetratricopeptide repeat protein [Gemmatimonadota bacterium]
MIRTLTLATCLLLVALPGCERGQMPEVPAVDVGEAEPRVAAHLTALRKAVLAHPDSAEAWGRLALNLQTHGHTEAAAQAYAAARNEAPESFPYHYLPAVMHAERGDERAGELFASARELRPDYSPLYLREAEWHLADGRPAEARRLLEEPAAPADFPATMLLLGRAALATGDTTEARRQLETAVGRAPRYGEAHAQLAELYRRGGDEERAELARARAEAFDSRPELEDPVYALVAREGVSARWHIVRAQSQLAAGRPEAAIEELREAVEIAPDDAHAVHLLGTALEQAGRLNQAIEQYRRALEIRPVFREAELNLSRALFRTGAREDATRHVREVLSADSSVAEAYLLLGMFEQAAGRPGQASRVYATGLRNATFDRHLAIRLAWILATSSDPALRNGQQAVALAERVNAVESFTDPASLDALAAAYAEYGDFPRAVAAARRGIGLAREAGNHQLAGAIERRLARYESSRPYRE